MYGVIFHDEEGGYFKARGLNASTIKKLSVSEPHFAASYMEKIPSLDTPFRKRGRAYHVLMLEGMEAYESLFVTHPIEYKDIKETKKDGVTVTMKPWNMNANVCKEWVAEQEAKGKQVLKPETDRLLREAAQFVPEEYNPFRGGFPEVSLFWEEEINGHIVQCKAGLDYLHEFFIGDLKTASHSMGKNVERIVADKARYEEQNIQAYFYKRGLEAIRRADANGIGVETDDQEAYKKVVIGDLSAEERQFFFLFQFLQEGCPEYIVREMRERDFNEEAFIPFQHAKEQVNKAIKIAADIQKGLTNPNKLNDEREFSPDGDSKRIFTNLDFGIRGDY